MYLSIFKPLTVVFIPLLLFVFGVIRIFAAGKRNGDAIYKPIGKGPIGFVIVVMYSIVFTVLIIGADNLLRLTIFSSFYLLGGGTFVERYLESHDRGVYSKMVVYPAFVCEWDNIEDVIFSGSSVKFIHKTKGAFEMEIEPTQYEKVKLGIQDRWVQNNKR